MLRSISLYIGLYSIIISFFSLLNIIYSQYFDFYLNITSYIYTLIISLVFGFTLILLQKKNNNNITLYEKLFVVLFGFFYFPLLISLPYYFSIYNLTFIDCYFEAISGFTSTGFTIFNNIKSFDESIILWRSTSQWLGGLYFLLSLILLIDVFNFKLKNYLTFFTSLNFQEIKKQFLKVIIIYFLLTLFIFLIFYLFDIRIFDSFNLSMTVISSGGFISSNILEDIIVNDQQKLILSFVMLISFFNLFLIYNLISLNKTISFYEEDLLLFFYFLFLIFFIFIFFNNYDFNNILLSLISSISNIGISFKNSPEKFNIFFLFITIIGGSIFSTSSGIKFIKFLLLTRYALNELFLIARPKYILNNKFYLSGLRIETKEINIYFLSFILFILSIIFLSSILSFDGIDFNQSLSLSILTLTNTVNSNIHNLEGFDFYNLNILSKIFIMLFMIIGRIEILSFLILLKKFFFKN